MTDDNGFIYAPYIPKVHVRRVFTWWPRREAGIGRLMIGKCFRNQFGQWVHPETVAFKVLEGKYRII